MKLAFAVLGILTLVAGCGKNDERDEASAGQATAIA